MVRRTVQALVYAAGLGLLGWLFFFVPLGERTLYEHAVRIAATEEAQDLGAEVEVASERVEAVIREKLSADGEVGDEMDSARADGREAGADDVRPPAGDPR